MTDNTIDDPWGNAVMNNHDNHAQSAFQFNHQTQQNNTSHEVGVAGDEVDPDGCSFYCLYNVLKVWHVIDIILGFCIILYGSLLAEENKQVQTITIALILFVGILLLLRAIFGTLALFTNHCERFGLVTSAGTSPILALIWFAAMFTNLSIPGRVQSYTKHHQLLWKTWQSWANNHRQTLTLLLLGAFLLESVRWQLVQKLLTSLNTLEHQQDERDRESAERRNRMPLRPWWWKHNSSAAMDRNDPLRSSLLPVTHDQLSTDNYHPAWSFFGRRRQERDDASVDFASVQEEWASRAEEDPYWWARDQNEGVDSVQRLPGEVAWTKTENEH